MGADDEPWSQFLLERDALALRRFNVAEAIQGSWGCQGGRVLPTSGVFVA